MLKTRVSYYAAALARRFGGFDIGRRQEVFALALVAVVLAGGLYSLLAFEPDAPKRAAPAAADERDAEKPRSPFDDVKIRARSVFVWDVREGRALYERNSDRVMPLASVTKVMTALTAVDILPSQSIVPITTESLVEEGDSGLYLDERWKLKDIVDFLLVVSSNDGARAVAAAAGARVSGDRGHESNRSEFIRKMNGKARAIGLTNTHFNNETGLDLSASGAEASGGYGTARDMAKLFEYAMKNYPEVLEATKYGSLQVSSADGYPHTAFNTNLDLNLIPGLIASKTGYTDLSGGNLVIVFNAGVNRPVVISVLGSTYDGRFDDVVALARATLDHLSYEGEAGLTATQ